MRNLNIICIQEEVVPWSAPNETIIISESKENQSNVIPEQMRNKDLNKYIMEISDRVIGKQVLANAVNRNSCTLKASNSEFLCSKQNCGRKTNCRSTCDKNLKRYQAEYFLN